MEQLSPTDRLPPDLRTYLVVLNRHKWLVLLLAVVIPVVAYVLSSRSAPVYQASSEVLLTRTAQGVTGINDPGIWNPQRAADTQVQLARVPAVAALALEAVGLENRSANGLLASSSVVASSNSDVMTFKVRDGDPETAVLLATEYARQYIRFRNELETAELKKARQALESQIDELRQDGQTGSPVYASLVEKQQQLLTAEAVASSTAKLIRPADGAPRIAPLPKRAAVLGLVLGLALGLGLVFLVEATDTRLRDPDDIAHALGLPLLAQIAGHRRLRRGRRLAMLDDADGPEGEAYRMLRTNIDLVNLDVDARTIMITSAVEEEGKSTTLANLALVYARAGRRVLLADLDLRRPTLAQHFELANAPGVTEVVAGRIPLEDAVQRIPLRDAAGRLDVLTSGAIPGNPGELVASGALDGLIEHMRARADIVLIDGPPMLLTGDTLTLSAKVDALIVTARSKVVRRPMVRELARLLSASPARKLGVVVTGATSQVARGYYGHYASRQRDRELVG